MKKIILLVIIALLNITLNSCSSDESGKDNNPVVVPMNPSGLIKFEINGVAKNFNNIMMEEDESYLYITARIGSSIADILEIKIYKDRVGTNALNDFRYIRNNETYFNTSEFTFFLDVNSNRTLTGSFAGQAWSGNALELKDGLINISY